jgi:hypothetical protein
MESLGYVALVNTLDGTIYRSLHRMETARNYWFVSPAIARGLEM